MNRCSHDPLPDIDIGQLPHSQLFIICRYTQLVKGLDCKEKTRLDLNLGDLILIGMHLARLDPNTACSQLHIQQAAQHYFGEKPADSPQSTTCDSDPSPHQELQLELYRQLVRLFMYNSDYSYC